MWLEECLSECDMVSEVLSECGVDSSCDVNCGEDSEFIVFMFSDLFVRVWKKRKCVYNWWLR